MEAILLVDDDAKVLDMVLSTLSPAKYRVDTVTYYDQALEYLKKTKYAVAILDYMLGEKTGLDLAKQIRYLHPDCAMILLTGHPVANIMTEAFASNVDSVLSKTSDLPKLEAIVEQAVRTHKIRLSKKQGITGSRDVLIVDDSPTYRKMVRQSIAHYSDFNIMEAEDGMIALEKMKTSDVKLIFLDYNMPRMNGIEFMKKVRADPKSKTVPIIMLTTEAEESKMTDGYMTGASVYLTKPFQAEALTKVVETMRYWHMK